MYAAGLWELEESIVVIKKTSKKREKEGGFSQL